VRLSKARKLCAEPSVAVTIGVCECTLIPATTAPRFHPCASVRWRHRAQLGHGVAAGRPHSLEKFAAFQGVSSSRPSAVASQFQQASRARRPDMSATVGLALSLSRKPDLTARTEPGSCGSRKIVRIVLPRSFASLAGVVACFPSGLFKDRQSAADTLAMIQPSNRPRNCPGLTEIAVRDY